MRGLHWSGMRVYENDGACSTHLALVCGSCVHAAAVASSLYDDPELKVIWKKMKPQNVDAPIVIVDLVSSTFSLAATIACLRFARWSSMIRPSTVTTGDEKVGVDVE
ncbi:hypothetical protein F5B20DRAFT_325853 [Whalleya microplaca]|nr:hypothetical protein F5B20DRAFT_325853 [Whalleya microplaca]